MLHLGMIKTIKHGINLIRHSLRDVGTGAKRSTHWPTLEKHFLEEHPTCEACGTKIRLNVHHCKPFHIVPALELDTSNLITLCMSRKECHLELGHLGNWKGFNPDVRTDAKKALEHPDRFEEIVKTAKARQE
jgi:5-methylcytosine-specific restriction enzyme A